MAEQRRVLDHGFLALDGAFASDLAVVNAARVSFNQKHTYLESKDEGLISFLMRERHGSPFEHNYFRFLVKCPLFVAREWHRHRVGHSYNEWSGRYSVIEPEFYIPSDFRTQVGKPGAYSFEPVDTGLAVLQRARMQALYEDAYAAYETALEQGIAKEQARMALPQATYTKFYWSCNARSLMHFLGLRNSNQAQWEIRQYAIQAESFFAGEMPITHAAFLANDRIAP